MTALDTSGLEAIKAKKPRPKKAEWTPLDLADLKPGVYLAADPSIDAFGLVLFDVTPRGECAVELAETFRTKPQDDVAGWEELLLRVGMLEEALDQYLTRWVFSTVPKREVQAVHEMPPQGGGKLARPEVALLASYAFRKACGHTVTRLKMVPRQSHARMICGNGNADKKVYHAILKERYLPEIVGGEDITNEATRDALCVALYASLTRS